MEGEEGKAADAQSDLQAKVEVLARRLGVIGAVFLLIGYALPLSGNFSGYYSLLLGPIGGGYRPPLQQLVFTPLEPLGLIAIVLFISLAPARGATRSVGAGVLMGIGIALILFFVRLVGVGLASHLAPWVALVGAISVFGAGLVAWRGRDL